MRKKGIYINAAGDKAWIGGLYYKRNILFSLLQNRNITNKFEIVVVVNKQNYDLFYEFENNVKFMIVEKYNFIFRLRQIYTILKYNVKYAYPMKEDVIKRILGIKCIEWIPDFQHKYYPEFFDEKELKKRDEEYSKISSRNTPLVVSSHCAAKDFEKFYGRKKNVYVVPFVSYIEGNIKSIDIDLEKKILRKYELENEYICVSNQFWKHKNHIIILKAVKYMNQNGMMPQNLKFVFTGYPEDKRNPEYYNELMELLNDNNIKNNVIILGFIERHEQIIIMKNSQFIIQPSLFEGWGTVVEDAKVLDKAILLSDIPVHREQMNKNCVLFEPDDYSELALKIVSLIKVKHKDDLNKGIKDMYESAKKYSLNFENILFDRPSSNF